MTWKVAWDPRARWAILRVPRSAAEDIDEAVQLLATTGQAQTSLRDSDNYVTIRLKVCGYRVLLTRDGSTRTLTVMWLYPVDR
jgi:mRNA-degrading endonuclease RelE of RelBE toxin-antitoxin system